MRKLLLGALVVVGALAAALASAVLVIDGERLRGIAIDYVERGGAELSIERVERTVGLSPRIEVHGLVLRDPEFTDSPLLEIEHAAFNVDLLSFLVEPVTLRDLVVESPMIVLPVADEGLLYWGPAIADLLERLRRFEWAVHGFRVDELETEALHTVHDARALLTAAAIEGTMPHIADLTLRVREIGGNLETTLPFPINGSIDIDELRLFHTDAELPVRLEADGHIGARPLSLRVQSGNMLKSDATARHAVNATLALESSTLQVNGTASRGAAPHFDLDVAADVVALAHVPDSEVRFSLTDKGDAWDFSDFTAAASDAVLSGGLLIERRDPRPLVTGALHVANLKVGSVEEKGSAAAGALPRDGTGAAVDPAEPAASSADRRAPLLGLVELALERLDRVDAVLDVEARDLQLFAVPVAALRGQLKVSDGRLELGPVDGEVLSGAAEARLMLAHDGAPPGLELATSFHGVETRELSAALGIDHEVFGELEGSLELASDGNAPGTMIGGAGGSATLLMSGGRLSAALANLVDMDFAERILDVFKKGETTPIHCAIAHFEGESGVFETRTLIVDTGEVKLVGSGTINLAEHTINLVLRPYGKDFDLLSADAPLRVTGPLSAPDVAPDKGAMAASLLTPIEIGQVEDAACQALISDASAAIADAARRTTRRRSRP